MLAVPAEDAGGQKRKHASADACLIGSLIRLVDTSGLEGGGTQWQSGETGGARRADRDTREFFVWTQVNGSRRASASVLDSAGSAYHNASPRKEIGSRSSDQRINPL